MDRSMRGRLAAAVGLVAALSLAFSLSIVPAFGDTVQDASPPVLTVLGQGQLVAKGVAVDLTLEFNCIPELTLQWASVNVRERFGRKVAMGYGSTSDLPTCRSPDTDIRTVTVFAQDTPFKPGTALVTMYASGWIFGDWFSFEVSQEVRLAKNAK